MNFTQKAMLLLLMVSALSFGQQGERKVFGKAVKVNPNNGLIRCVTTEYEKSLQTKFPNRATSQEFENWIAPKVAEAKKNLQARNAAIVITIPVVVHVIHNGDAVGVNENIADARVISQITVLNQDYRRMLGTPGYNTNAVGADVELQFCLAQTDPDGLPTTGIDRRNLGVTNWATNASVENTLKPQTQWDPKRYFNIWVANFSSNSSAELYGILGYAQFPNYSGLGGLNEVDGPANTDGVIIDYRCFGSKSIANVGTYYTDYDQGRTATHEIGHCFGLRHIWGDGAGSEADNSPDCTASDFCNDTPQAGWEHYICGTFDTCPSAAGNDMDENYMDYTNDTCMNTFTLDQKARILAVLQNSPRRKDLVTSTACNTAQTFQNDGSLSVPNVNVVGCTKNFAPSLTLKNIGTATLTSATVSYNVDGGTPSTYAWTGSLATGATGTFALPAITTTSGDHVLNTSLTLVNGVADTYIENSTKTTDFTIDGFYNTATVNFTLQRDIYGSETTWTFKNSAGTTLYSGGPYTDVAALPAVFTQAFTVTNGQCYTFTISDAYGDGFCCDYGNGYYSLKTANNTVIISSDGAIGAAKVTRFGIDSSLSTAAFDALNTIVLYPNPAKDVINIGMSANTTLPESYVIYNTLGQTIKMQKISSQNDLSISTSAFSHGVYFIKLTKEGETKTLQFVKD